MEVEAPVEDVVYGGGETQTRSHLSEYDMKYIGMIRSMEQNELETFILKKINDANGARAEVGSLRATVADFQISNEKRGKEVKELRKQVAELSSTAHVQSDNQVRVINTRDQTIQTASTSMSQNAKTEVIDISDDDDPLPSTSVTTGNNAVPIRAGDEMLFGTDSATTTTFALPTMTAPNEELPHKPYITSYELDDKILLSWDISDAANGYQIYGFKEPLTNNNNLHISQYMWEMLVEQNPRPSSMQFSIKKPIDLYYVMVREVDVLGRVGPFCDPETIRKQRQLDPPFPHRLPRTRMSGEALAIVEQFYIKNSHPKIKERAELAEDTGHSLDKITNWFVNRRAREKKNLKQRVK